ncbi:MAG TPA: hypothetical protein VGO43_12375 [Pyrinomonadaceae bacterium]|nr:hypothetical protein [Pyrinomonadaceae bacterium]
MSTSVGYNGAFENREGTLTSLTIGSITVSKPAVLFFGKGTGHDDVPWDVNIGNVFLKDYVLTIDYPGKKLMFEKP